MGEAVEIASAGPITSVTGCVAFAVGVALSTTLMVKLKVPETVGVPLKTPPVASDNPVGKDPTLTFQV